MMPFRQSLVFRIFVISFILLAVPLLVDSFVIVQARYNDNVRAAKEYLLKVPDSRIFVLSRVLQVKKQSLAFSEYFLGLKDHFPEKMDEELNKKIKVLSGAGGFEDALILKIEPNGDLTVVGSSFENDVKNDFRSFDFYKQIAAREQVRGEFSNLFDFPQGVHHLLFGKVIYESDGKTPKGIMIFLLDVTAQLNELLATTHGLAEMHFAILQHSMMVIAAEDTSLQFEYFFPLSLEKLELIRQHHPLAADALKNEPLKLTYVLGSPFLEFGWKGANVVGVITAIPDTDFYLLNYTTEDQIFVNPFISFFSIYVIFGMILVFGGQCAYLSSRRISRPFHRLSEVMQTIQGGDLLKRYPPDPLGFEINNVGLAFNEMIDTLLEKKFLAEEEKVRGEIYDKELRIGQQVQRGLLPTRMPKMEGIEIAEKYIPAKEVGGDFYDVFARKIDGKEQMVLVVADASGKGVQACFYSLGVRSALRVFARENREVADVAKNANRLFYFDSGDTGMFVTTLIGIYDPETKELSYCSCGHNPPYVRRKDGSLETLGGVGMALGVRKEVEPISKKVNLNEGDLVVFFTDGVTEMHNDKNELFSEERLEKFIKERGDQSAKVIAEELIVYLREFQGKALQHDDITLLLMKLL